MVKISVICDICFIPISYQILLNMSLVFPFLSIFLTVSLVQTWLSLTSVTAVTP
jgi:hypothetical protein